MSPLPSFRDFYGALWDAGDETPRAPFPWQVRLAERVGAEGWPRAISIPTGCGKTSIIDVWVWALANSALDDPRRQSRRLFFVIDRRIVVDDVFTHARTIADKLAMARGGAGPLASAAEALSALGGDPNTPLLAARLRGGMELDPAWAENPAQPLICASTVDQVGSRLLFRGYGLSRGIKNSLPVHAALTGTDALVVLDEAHLSAPFAQTLTAIETQAGRREAVLGVPWAHVHMTATPRPGLPPATVFTLDNDDREDPRLQMRLQARKPARLIPAPKRALDPVVTACVHQVKEWLNAGDGPRRIGVVVNRVARARAIRDELGGEEKGIHLLIGPARPIDKDEFTRHVLPGLHSGRPRDPDGERVVLVATQTVEVGLDIDLDALVTECAPSDSLRQRFGRLDRLGRLAGEAKAAVVESPSKEPDPIYGDSLAATWTWLNDVAEDGHVDFGISAGLDPPPETRTTAGVAPVLFPAYVDRWSQTSPLPTPDPAVAPFLHGPENRPADVEIVWRADLHPDRPGEWRDVVALAPPTGYEALRVSFTAARRWLMGLSASEVSDVEGAIADHALEERQALPRAALRWCGASGDDTGLVIAGRPAGSGGPGVPRLRPGDTIVVPAAYGGCDKDGWAPESSAPVIDRAEGASMHAGGTLLRLHTTVLGDLATKIPATSELLVWSDEHDGALVIDRDKVDLALQKLIDVIAEPGADPATEPNYQQPQKVVDEKALWMAARALMATPVRDYAPYPTFGDGLPGGVVVATRHARAADEDAFLSAGSQVLLDRHAADVHTQAQSWAKATGMPSGICAAIEIAARHHDDGKEDPRFQALLYGGPALARPLIAKSGGGRRDRRQGAAGFAQSGLPRGFRHEAVSLSLLSDEAWADADVDGDLVRHLVASHHGCARPSFSYVDEKPWRDVSALTRVDGEVPERYWRLTRRYGWWGLALIESILRLADHRASRDEEELT